MRLLEQCLLKEKRKNIGNLEKNINKKNTKK